MMSPAQAFQILYGRIRREWRYAFLTCFFTGLLVHMPMLLSDIPNHDGLDSMYFDQNMITSGRWFLSVACGFSSYYTIPWVIGLLGLTFLGVAAAALCELLEVRKLWAVMGISALLAVFPALASTFAYVYTLDGYMLALMLAVLAVLFTKRFRTGFLAGALCLAFSMGIYQGYLPFAMILSIYAVLMLLAENGGQQVAAEWDEKRLKTAKKRRWEAPNAEKATQSGREKPGEDRVRPGEGRAGAGTAETIRVMLHYLYMGVLGAGFYYGILQILLRIQGKELDTYQGISGMASGNASGGLLSTIAEMYVDFFKFFLKGNVLFQNTFSLAAWVLLAFSAAAAVFLHGRRRKYWKNPHLLVIMVAAVLALPLATNIILLVSPEVNYHLLMRYQWVLYAVGAVALAGNGGCGTGMKKGSWPEWGALLSAAILVFCYCITDNIAYANLQKRYEKTYAYCIRLLDRIEQTEGYFPGIPIAMVGVVGDEQYPVTDITLPVTSGMIGMNGDSLLYRGDNYRIFIRNYLGATLNILPPEAMAEMYYSEEYTAMDSFPGENSIRIIDGIMYIKTENMER